MIINVSVLRKVTRFFFSKMLNSFACTVDDCAGMFMLAILCDIVTY